jgi:hypothetical protein
MATTTIRKKLITYLAGVDEKKIKAVYTLFEEDIERTEVFKLSKQQLSVIEERRKRHKNGRDGSVSWKAAHKAIRSKRKSS